ncbi:RNA-directed DNA polymerase from mobile element jockey-like [Brachionus plicatilis]|uniref:RNA-directed DNA polymerase from mobile element jockey-like n=1 Tax=Brachionus plicatilis TaxID=10195 RepID=A0A3M7PGB7_BRAPC|nr:RNA-directed DNA polymerase from mobile element jockey-like [Brachionus plicatilis]
MNSSKETNSLELNQLKIYKDFPTWNTRLLSGPLTGPARGIRGHARRLSGQVSIKCLQRANTFTNRVVNEWNALPASVVNATSVNQFKNRYDAFRSCTQTTVP